MFLSFLVLHGSSFVRGRKNKPCSCCNCMKTLTETLAEIYVPPFLYERAGEHLTYGYTGLIESAHSEARQLWAKQLDMPVKVSSEGGSSECTRVSSVGTLYSINVKVRQWQHPNLVFRHCKPPAIMEYCKNTRTCVCR